MGGSACRNWIIRKQPPGVRCPTTKMISTAGHPHHVSFIHVPVYLLPGLLQLLCELLNPAGALLRLLRILLCRLYQFTDFLEKLLIYLLKLSDLLLRFNRRLLLVTHTE